MENNLYFYIRNCWDINKVLKVINQIMCVKVNKTVRDRGKFQNRPP